jgi:hypothetical protein
MYHESYRSTRVACAPRPADGDFSVVDGSFVPNSGDDTPNVGNGNDGLRALTATT